MITIFKTKFLLQLGVLFVAGAIGIIALTSYNIEAASKVQTEWQIIIEMHKMANNYIIAEDIRGKQEMTKERLAALKDKLISVENVKDYPHKDHLIDILTVWNQGEFFMLANDHNYLWDVLGGQIGRATGVKEKKDLPDWSI